jgi:hypothetical protein
MPSMYTNNILGFLASRPEDGRWESELPIDDVHREAIRLGLIRSAGPASLRGKTHGGVRPFELTEDGEEMRQEAMEAFRTSEDELSIFDEDPPDESGVVKLDDEPVNRDGLLAALVFGVITLVASLAIWWSR